MRQSGSAVRPHSPLRLEDLPDLATVPEVAAALRIGRGKAYQLVRSGALPSVTFGRTLRVPKRALERLLEGETS